ncbi:MAG: polysulfide reductase NrfD [Acidobacteriota bacterium]|nr:polysulfide reductase NrfD [Acidobacteriota bacterium]
MSYYGLPMLKRPRWGWEIALYFFSEGISSGSFILGTMAELFGEGCEDGLARQARYLSLATLLPCPPLLIADLGRPERFHHMMRVFKPSSPMNLGAWALTGFSQPVVLLAFARFSGSRRIPSRALGIAGLPFAFFMMCYPGVLLSTTSIPVWARSPWLGALLGTSSMASAASALSLIAPHSKALDRVDRISHAAEALAFSAYIATAGSSADPLTKGRFRRLFVTGAFVAGIVAPAVVNVVRGKSNRKASALSAALSLAGALALKWAVVHAGRDSADDPANALRA